MYLLSFLILVSLFFIVQWLADIFFTLKSVKKLGYEIETNPIFRFLLGTRRKYLYLFKTLELIVFFGLIYLVSTYSNAHAFYGLLFVSFVYFLVTLQGMRIYLQVEKDTTPVILLFATISLICLLFIYLNYDTFNNSTKIYTALKECNEAYQDTYTECFGVGSVSDKDFLDYTKYNLSVKIPK